MAITGPVLCTRDQVKLALDLKESARVNTQVDRAVTGAAGAVQSLLNRSFFPTAATRYFDWPTWDRGRPWRLWLNQHEAISVSQLTSGGTVIPNTSYFLEPVNDGPPYSRIELDRSKLGGWTAGATPQRSIAVTGVFGFGQDTVPGGALAAAISTAAATTCTVTDSSQAEAGSTLLVDTERMLVTDRNMTSTGQAQQGAGAGTASAADVSLTVTDGTKYFAGETVLLDSERMLIVDISGNVLTVKRAWDGTVLATHSGATVYAPRLLTVVRGTLGTTAATHLISAPVAVHAVPGLVNDLGVAEAINIFLSDTSGWARTVGEGDNLRMASGAGLRDLRAQCVAAFGRQARRRVV